MPKDFLVVRKYCSVFSVVAPVISLVLKEVGNIPLLTSGYDPWPSGYRSGLSSQGSSPRMATVSLPPSYLSLLPLSFA